MSATTANQYFDQHVKSDTWYGFSADMRSKALAQAERILAPYRGTQNFDYAVNEQALWLLQADKRVELQQLGVSSFAVGGISERFALQDRPVHIAPQAWVFIRQSGGGIRMGSLK